VGKIPKQERKTNPDTHNKNARSPRALDIEISRRLNWIVKAHKFAEENFDAKIIKHADWVLIKLLLENERRGRATVVKHMIEASQCAAGTVRHMFSRLRKNGYIVVEQKIGRSELYRPTAKLKQFVDKWTEATLED
jgi:hypothetical protein